MAPQRQISLANMLSAAGIVLLAFGSITTLYAQVQRQGDEIKTLKDSLKEDRLILLEVRDGMIRIDERQKRQLRQGSDYATRR